MNKTLISKGVMEAIFSFAYKAFRYVLLLGVSYLAIYPILTMVSTALTEAESFYNKGAGLIPSVATFENFKNFQIYFNYFDHAKVTALITLTSTVCSVFVCSLIGYGLGRYQFKGRNIVYAAVLFTIIMPLQTAQIPQIYYLRWFDFFSIGKLIGLFTGETVTVNLLTNLGRFIVPALFGVGLKAGIFIFLFQSFFAGMPKDLEEAAKLDGCNPFKIYWKVMLPNIIPVLVTVTLLCLIYYWNDSLVAGMAKLDMGTPLMVEVEKLVVLNIGAEELTVMRRKVEYYSILLTAVLPLIVVFIFGQRFFVECMDRSGSKG
ncbi:MAG: carbohydrate ABC transporter permease [Oscillospiraceae bacterium]|nr:carbohydrate ABC transporter permease [Oscillospiraceae bacterium]